MQSTRRFEEFAARLREFIRVSTRNSPEMAGNDAGATIQDSFDRLALELFALQFEHNAPYRRFCEARLASPQGTKHWHEIPAVPTTAFKDLELSCLPPAERTTVFHSSGTTAQRPSRHFHNSKSLALYQASLWPWFSRHFQLPISNCQLKQSPEPGNQSAIGYWLLTILTPPPAHAPHSSLVHMFETIRRRIGAPESVFLGGIAGDSAWTLNLETALGTLREAVNTGQPLALLGTAFSFVHLLDHLIERGLRFKLPPGSRALETGGYKNRSRSLPKTELHALLTARLGIPPVHILCEYGMSELSSQAYDLAGSRPGRDPTPRHFQFPPWARAQVISPETGREVEEGETGLIRVFDLANVYSVIAIQTEDLGIRRGERFELIGRVTPAEPRGCSLMAATDDH